MMKRKFKYEFSEPGELKEIAPRLSAIGKTDPFKIPENYFESLSNQILFRINNRSENSLTRYFRLDLIQPKFAYAALAVIVFIFAVIYINHRQFLSTKQELTEFTLEDILMESPELIESLDDNLLFETLILFSDQSVISKLDSSFIIDQNINSSELIEYLSEESLTPDLLFNL